MSIRQRGVQGGRERLMHCRRIAAFDPQRLIAIAAHELRQLVVADAREHRRVGNFVAVQMQYRQDAAVARGVQEFIRMPARRQRTRLRFAVADHAGDDEIGIVEGRAIRMRKRVAELAAFMNGSGCFRRDVAGHAVRPRKLAEEPLQTRAIVRDRRVAFGVAAFEIGIRNQPRAAVAGPDDVNHIEIVAAYQPVQMHVYEVQPRRGAPVAEQTRLDML